MLPSLMLPQWLLRQHCCQQLFLLILSCLLSCFSSCIVTLALSLPTATTTNQNKTKKPLFVITNKRWPPHRNERSQNPRMVAVAKDHNAHPVPTPAMCRVANHQTNQAAQSHIQPGLECLKGWGIHNLLGQPVPVPHHPLGEELPPNGRR